MDRPLAEVAWWCALALGAVPLVAYLIWFWNDAFFWATLRLRALADHRPSGKLPPGHMGLPFFGEMPLFLWFFKVIRRPDDYIASKRDRYGEGPGLYRSHLFGGPTIISCSPASNKFVLQSADDFHIRWPSAELVGRSSISVVEGKRHARLRNFIVGAINSPESLRRIAQVVQPRVASSLRAWAEKGTIRAFDEATKVTFENICKMFASMEPGPLLDSLDQSYAGLLAGIRAYPLNLPGTAFHHALKCRRYMNGVFREELERRKRRQQEKEGDLIDGLMQVEDEAGEKLSDDEVVDSIVSLIVGGYQSTALSISWALYHLSKSPGILRKLQEENAAVSKGNNGAFITPEDISKMKYTSKVVEETIRMANIAWVTFRVANRDVQYEETCQAGHVPGIRRGIQDLCREHAGKDAARHLPPSPLSGLQMGAEEP
uniref:Ent-kaurenoic acid oxidase 2 n=1 Tax=Anthurium amnicola TaxID=1678845 RepID=A0A1D1XNZ6_9ARAE